MSRYLFLLRQVIARRPEPELDQSLDKYSAFSTSSSL
jgi:hypothetical protein